MFTTTLLDWSCQDRDYGFAFYGHPVLSDKAPRHLRHLSIKILYDTGLNTCCLQIHFNDYWHGERSIEFAFAKLSDAWAFTETVIMHLKAHPDEFLQIGVFS
jgi:hypothetical protein